MLTSNRIHYIMEHATILISFTVLFDGMQITFSHELSFLFRCISCAEVSGICNMMQHDDSGSCHPRLPTPIQIIQCMYCIPPQPRDHI